MDVPLCRPRRPFCYFFGVALATQRGARGRLGVKAAASALALGLAVVAGCGSERPRPAGEQAITPPPAGGSSGGFEDAGSKPPGCGQKDDGSYCDCVDVPLFTEPPNMYFVLDRSGSMIDNDKWGRVRGVVAQILRGLGPRANFGATVYPGFDQSQCAPPREVLKISPGDPVGTDGPTTKTLLSATATGPYGGTPTAEALRYVLPLLKPAVGKTFVILATDGAPNCSSQPCGYDRCLPNIENIQGCPSVGPKNCCEPPEGSYFGCLDGPATRAAVEALKTAGYLVYVVGMPGSATYGSLLDELAVAGGTAQGATSPKYYRVDSPNDTEILAALKKVAAKIVATCEFTLKEAPAAPDNVNVYLDEKILPKDPANGWKIDGAKVTLLGTACDRVLAGDVLGVRIIAGCPTVGPR